MRTTFAAAALIGAANAWWGTGHILVARRAQQILEEENPAVLQAALDELVALKESNPDITESEGDHPFSECATFADEIKGEGYWWTSDWHFTDIPYLNEGGKVSDYPDFYVDPYYSVAAVDNMSAWLQGVGDYEAGHYYYEIKKDFPDEATARSFALRMVIHIVGDMHQPFHNVSEINSEYPAGDRGGNDEQVPSEDSVSNLHAVWDSVIYEYPGYPNLPLNTSDWDWYTTEADAIAKEYPVTADLQDGDFQAWAQDAFELSVEDGYAGFTEDESPSAEYRAQGEQIAKSQITLGGRRLADLMVQIYGTGAFLQ